jgi:hypothetical protein
MPTRAVLIHGYSETSLSAYAEFPQVLRAVAPELADIVLCAFDSLDDAITIDDLTGALELRMRAVEGRPHWDTADSVLIAHSTGALVARRWILNRAAAGKAIPSHLITMAGANHGSTLAQLGKTPLGYVHQFLNKESLGVGAGVLTDLDYGSDFLLRLNREWLALRNGDATRNIKPNPVMQKLFAFSMGGNYNGSIEYPEVNLLWASAESGSDNTVRMSGANLNYTYLLADTAAGTLEAVASAPQAHLVVDGKSHYGEPTGILASNKSPTDVPMQAIRQALNVTTAAQYADVVTDWTNRSHALYTAKPGDTNSTVVFLLRDQNGLAIDDCFIGFLDANTPGIDATQPDVQKSALVKALSAVSGAILPRQPIHNDVQRGSYSFYVNTATFDAIQTHAITISASTSTDYVTYGPLNYKVDHTLVERMIFPNQFTYVDIVLPRIASATFAIYETTPWPPVGDRWMPFPPGGRFDPPPDAH